MTSGGAGFPSFEVLYPNNEATRDFCEAAAAQWRSVLGVQPRLVNQAWKVFLDSPEDIYHAVGYVEDNPEKEGKRRQRWPFVIPYV